MTDTLVMLRLADAGREAQLRQQGYVVFDFLNLPQVASLRQIWHTHEPAMRGWPYAASLFSPDAHYRQTLSQAVAAAIQPRLDQCAPEAQLVYGGFTNKAPCEPASVVPFHQDPSFVDEARWGAANIWIPLVDLDDDNGPLWVVPGSHRFNRGLRGFNQLFAYDAHEADLKSLARPLYARAGQAILFSHSLFHFSPPTRSDHARPAAGGLLVERGAPLHYNFVDPDDRAWIEIYPADPSLFLAAPIATRPSSPMSGRARALIEAVDLATLHAAARRC